MPRPSIPRPHSVTDAEIKHLTGYITDDQYIASYLGIDRKRVAKVRAETVQTDPRRFSGSHYVAAHDSNENSGIDNRLAEKLAELANRQMRSRLTDFFERDAKRRRCTMTDAMALNLYGRRA